jgi:hypothetical protein
MQQETRGPHRFLAIALILAAGAMPASAQPRAIGQFQDWAVFTEERGDDLICFAASRANDAAPRNVRHGDVWFHVTFWRSGAAREQPSLRAGYDFDSGSNPRLSIGRSQWTLFTSGGEAFANDADDPRIVEAVRRGAQMRVEARSARSTNVSYRFSLRGSSNAIDRAAQACS